MCLSLRYGPYGIPLFALMVPVKSAAKQSHHPRRRLPETGDDPLQCTKLPGQGCAVATPLAPGTLPLQELGAPPDTTRRSINQHDRCRGVHRRAPLPGMRADGSSPKGREALRVCRVGAVCRSASGPWPPFGARRAPRPARWCIPVRTAAILSSISWQDEALGPSCIDVHQARSGEGCP